MLRQSLIFLSGNSVARRIAMHAPGARSMARRFVAGESVEDGIRTTRALNDVGMTVTLDYLGESVSRRNEATAAADMYIRMMDRIMEERLDANVSVKLTQMGQDIDRDFVKENARRILDRAREHNMFVRFDMEDGEHLQSTLDLFRSFWDEGYHNVGIVLQSYMFRSEADARMANELGARVRLCKGAYREPPEIAFQEKVDVDRNYVSLMRLLLDEGTYPAIATHDEAIIRKTTDHVAQKGLESSAFEFQMLYGVRRDLQARLRRQGHRVRIYVPFGGAWYPYLMRRMAERPANMLFIVNAVLAESPFRFLVKRSDSK